MYVMFHAYLLNKSNQIKKNSYSWAMNCNESYEISELKHYIYLLLW